VRQGYASKEYLESLQDYGSSLDRTKVARFLSLYRDRSTERTGTSERDVVAPKKGDARSKGSTEAR
jgi:hypothetical protein